MRINSTLKAAQGLNNRIEMTTNTAQAMRMIAWNRYSSKKKRRNKTKRALDEIISVLEIMHNKTDLPSSNYRSDVDTAPRK